MDRAARCPVFGVPWQVLLGGDGATFLGSVHQANCPFPGPTDPQLCGLRVECAPCFERHSEILFSATFPMVPPTEARLPSGTWAVLGTASLQVGALACSPQALLLSGWSERGQVAPQPVVCERTTDQAEVSGRCPVSQWVCPAAGPPGSLSPASLGALLWQGLFLHSRPWDLAPCGQGGS